MSSATFFSNESCGRHGKRLRFYCSSVQDHHLLGDSHASWQIIWLLSQVTSWWQKIRDSHIRATIELQPRRPRSRILCRQSWGWIRENPLESHWRSGKLVNSICGLRLKQCHGCHGYHVRALFLCRHCQRTLILIEGCRLEGTSGHPTGRTHFLENANASKGILTSGRESRERPTKIELAVFVPSLAATATRVWCSSG